MQHDQNIFQSTGLTVSAVIPSIALMISLTNAADSSILGVVTGVEPQSSKSVTLQQGALGPRATQLIQEDGPSTMAKLRACEGLNTICDGVR